MYYIYQEMCSLGKGRSTWEYYKNGSVFTGGTRVLLLYSSLFCLLCYLSSCFVELVSFFFFSFFWSFLYWVSLIKPLELNAPDLKSNALFLIYDSWLDAESLWLSSAISVLLAVVFVGICSVMAIYALAHGETKHIKILPELNNGVSFFDLFTAIPVIVTAFTFHFNGKNKYLIIVLREICCQNY